MTVATREELMAKSPEEIKAICESLNIKSHHREKLETKVEKILSQSPSVRAAAATKPKEEPEINHTWEDVLAAIKPFTDKGMVAKHNAEENTWYFSHRGREEVGNMQIPLKVIRMKADSVSRGALLPPMDKDANGKFMWAAR